MTFSSSLSRSRPSAQYPSREHGRARDVCERASDFEGTDQIRRAAGRHADEDLVALARTGQLCAGKTSGLVKRQLHFLRRVDVAGEHAAVQALDGARHGAEAVQDHVGEARRARRRRDPVDGVEVAGELGEVEPGRRRSTSPVGDLLARRPARAASPSSPSARRCPCLVALERDDREHVGDQRVLARSAWR